MFVTDHSPNTVHRTLNRVRRLTKGIYISRRHGEGVRVWRVDEEA